MPACWQASHRRHQLAPEPEQRRRTVSAARVGCCSYRPAGRSLAEVSSATFPSSCLVLAIGEVRLSALVDGEKKGHTFILYLTWAEMRPLNIHASIPKVHRFRATRGRRRETPKRFSAIRTCSGKVAMVEKKRSS